MADIGDAFNSERGTNTSQIKNDYISIGIEDDIITAEEFETIYNAFLVIGTFESHAHAWLKEVNQREFIWEFTNDERS